MHDTDIEYFDNHHDVFYQGVNDCLVNKNYCWKVCREFRIGITSNLFIGQLKVYKHVLKSMQDIISHYSEKPVSYDELGVLDEHYSGEFFSRPNDTIVQNNMNVLKDSNLSRWEMLFVEDGIDLFDIAVNSNYFLTDGMNYIDVKSHYSIFLPNSGSNTPLNPGVIPPATGYMTPPTLSNLAPEVNNDNAPAQQALLIASSTDNPSDGSSSREIGPDEIDPNSVPPEDQANPNFEKAEKDFIAKLEKEADNYQEPEVKGGSHKRLSLGTVLLLAIFSLLARF
jgi:hypothetical protein